MTHSIFYDETDFLLNNEKDDLHEGDKVLINMYGFNPEKYFRKTPFEINERLLERYLQKCNDFRIKVSMYNLSEEVFDKYFSEWKTVELIR